MGFRIPEVFDCMLCIEVTCFCIFFMGMKHKQVVGKCMCELLPENVKKIKTIFCIKDVTLKKTITSSPGI